MTAATISIEPDELELIRKNSDVLILDLSAEKNYIAGHIPEAHHLPYPHIVRIQNPVMGLLPEAAVFSQLLSDLGAGPNTHIISYDDEGGGCAARLLWTLRVFGHHKASILNGGIFSWSREAHEMSTQPPTANRASQYNVHSTQAESITAEQIMQKLGSASSASSVLVDARSLAEYTGVKKFAARGGHIPGAIHYEWTEAMDQNHNMRILPAAQLQQRLDALNISRDKEVICYCQSHHRSAYVWAVLKQLGYENVKGYPGSWSDWGNRTDTPVEV